MGGTIVLPGETSDGLKVEADSWTEPISVGETGAVTTAQGTRSRSPESGAMVRVPAIAGAPTGLTCRAVTLTAAASPGASVSNLGWAASLSAASAERPARKTRSQRVETLRIVTERVELHPGPVARAKASVAGCETSSTPAAAPISTSPSPCAACGVPRRLSAVPTSALRSSGAVSSGRAWTAMAASPATTAAAALAPSTSTKRDFAPGVTPGSTVTTPTPGPATSGFGWPP